MAEARQGYTSGNLGRIQQEAVTRMRQMQDKAHQSSGLGGATFRNWSTNPNFRRGEQPPYQQQPQQPLRQPPPEPPIYTPPPPQPPPLNPATEHFTPPPEQHSARQANPARAGSNTGQPQPPPPRPNNQAEAKPPPEKPKDTTLLQDILGGVGLDDDRILILGLILILINDKADTTLILALLYLLL